MKDYFLPFVGAFIVFGAVFFGLDFAMMHLQGLTLTFKH